jgi:hypothetical protein
VTRAAPRVVPMGDHAEDAATEPGSEPGDASGEEVASDGPPPAPTENTLTATQRDVLDQLGASTSERPTFDPDLGRRIRAHLEDALRQLLDGDGDGDHPSVDRAGLPLWVSKHHLALVHSCEGRYLAGLDEPFEWRVPIAVGTVVHKAIELGVFWGGATTPRLLVDEAIESLTSGTDSIGDWLYALDEAGRAELRGRAVEMVSAFEETFPPLRSQWRPVTEARLRADLHGGDVRLSGKVDLTLGQAHGDLAGKVLIDFKTGSVLPHHLDDLRFYALLETLARGTPPRLLATAYLDSGRLRTEDVTPDLLAAAVRRTTDGIAAVVALRLAGDEPTLSPGLHCRWCPAQPTCETGQRWLADTEDPDRYDPD